VIRLPKDDPGHLCTLIGPAAKEMLPFHMAPC
jgi:hypothetical protein